MNNITFRKADPPTHVLNLYTPPKWTMTITGDLVVHLPKSPNRFHRFMQRLVLGFKWEKIEQQTK